MAGAVSSLPHAPSRYDSSVITRSLPLVLLDVLKNVTVRFHSYILEDNNFANFSVHAV
jgi:hypothetical protein